MFLTLIFSINCKMSSCECLTCNMQACRVLQDTDILFMYRDIHIATGYGLDGPGIESRWGRDFPHLSRPTLEPTQPPVQWVPGLSRG
jgi:hypothetical protein